MRQIMDHSDIDTALVAALLHDVGQYPLAHDLEEADSSGFGHEHIGYSIIANAEHGLTEEVWKPWKTDAERVVRVLSADPTDQKVPIKDRILHSILDGPIDADKLDYLVRDSRNLGLTYGSVIDLDRLIRTLTVVFGEQDGRIYTSIGIHEKGKVPAEAVAFARYAMYGQVYWHHAHRAIKSMFQFVVWTALAEQTEPGRTALRKAFREFVAPARPSSEQARLPHTTDAASAPLADYTEVQVNDLRVVAWFAERAGRVGADFMELLGQRKIYKRILVLTHNKLTDDRLWTKLTKLVGDRARWKRMTNLQRAFQSEVVKAVEAADVASAESLLIEPNARNTFLAAASSGMALLLIDVPSDRADSAQPLEYVVEEDRRRHKADALNAVRVEGSAVWEKLGANLLSSIGKVRVFCHPDHVAFVAAQLDRRSLEDCLSRALKVEAADGA